MAFNITVPWKIHLRGPSGAAVLSWWTRKKSCDDPGKHPTLMKEQDLDHLGVLHDAALHGRQR